jgi:hypothetical protein
VPFVLDTMGCYGLQRDDFDLIMVPSRPPHAPEAGPCTREAPAPEAGPCVAERSTEAGPSAEPPTPLRPPLQALDATPGDTDRCERISGAAKAPTRPASAPAPRALPLGAGCMGPGHIPHPQCAAQQQGSQCAEQLQGSVL